MRKTVQNGWTIAAIAGVTAAAAVSLVLGLAAVGCAGGGDDAETTGAQAQADKAEDDQERTARFTVGEHDMGRGALVVVTTVPR